MPEITAWCMKCKAKRSIKNPQSITHPNGRAAITGTCPACGTKIFRMGGMPEADAKSETVTKPKPKASTAPEEEKRTPGSWAKRKSKVQVSS